MSGQGRKADSGWAGFTANLSLNLEMNPGSRAFTRIGTRVPLHCTGAGKTYLAHLPEGEVRAIVKERGLPQFTSNTIAALDRLLEELKTMRELRYALDDEERVLAPQLDWTREP